MSAVTLSKGAVEITNGRIAPTENGDRSGTIASKILAAHHHGTLGKNLNLVFDSLTSHDITYVGIIQTARASGLERFPVPYVLTNCHNSLCAVGGTINQDDHVFALSAAKKYGGIYVPANLAVIHSYNREMMAGCGKMILGSDSHTRYGALGTMGVGEGGGELAKQLLGRTYDMGMPEVIAVYLTGTPQPGIGPQDVALQIIKAVYNSGYVKNKVMEFVGPGIAGLPVDYRCGIDVMTTETTCWSSIWQTDGAVEEYLAAHGRAADYRELRPAATAYYDGCVTVDLGAIEASIALPFHPSNVYTINDVQHHAYDIFATVEKEAARAFESEGVDASKVKLDLRSKIRDGAVYVDQGIIAGCSGGTFDNVMAAAGILDGQSCGAGAFNLSVYPDSQPVYQALVANGAVATLMAAGAVLKPAFCGPCFGAGDTPANGELSLRHTTRNFVNREGSKPTDGQIAAVALMDARSIAATAANGGKLTAATEAPFASKSAGCQSSNSWFSPAVYEKRVFYGFGKGDPKEALHFGPNIIDWPKIPSLPEHLLVRVCAYITDPVTTTDELIPSGETSSYRSNPLRLAEFTLSRKDPGYVGRAKAAITDAVLPGLLIALRTGDPFFSGMRHSAVITALQIMDKDVPVTAFSAIYAHKPGDGSAREQAASCQRVLGGAANFAREYATKRYRSNLLNWGIVPFLVSETDAAGFGLNDYIFVPNIRKAISAKADEIDCLVLKESGAKPFKAKLGALTDTERQILLDGCLINYYAKR